MSDLNPLFPIFLKANQLKVLIVGGGYVALEKLTALWNNSLEAEVKLVAPEVKKEIKDFLNTDKQIEILERKFEVEDLEGIDWVIIAVGEIGLSEAIRIEAKKQNLLVNVADKPNLCDFYLGSIVTKGNLKLAISTNGKSPTFAKRLKQVLNDSLPDNMEESLDNLNRLRVNLKGDFQEKVDTLNKITASLVEKQKPKYWWDVDLKKSFAYTFGVLGILIAGHILFSLLPPTTIWKSSVSLFNELNGDFLWFMLGGFIAQMIDGALGMAYGVSATTFLLSFGVSPAVASMSVHASEIFTSGVSGLMHLKFGNVNSKLFKVIVLPGVLGSILGAYILTEFESYNSIIKPIVGCYTLILGIVIIIKVIKKHQKRKKLKRVGWLATAGGFLDAIGGGGWGPVVSSTLIASGKNPRMVIGSVNLAEFFVSLASSFTFFTLIGGSGWQTILGLILGGVVAAPIAAHFSKKLNVKAMMILVGTIVIIVSLRIIYMAIFK
jgi:siroheme synthase-like protein